MKKVIVLFLVVLSAMVSCKKEAESSPEAVEEMTVQAAIYNECYVGIMKNDSVFLNISIQANQLISG